MKDRSKNKKNSSIDESTEILIHALVEQEVEEMENEIDPYEGYVQRVRMHIHRNTNEFYKRFRHGYEALINEVKSTKDDRSNFSK